jgi:hypothetical protein
MARPVAPKVRTARKARWDYDLGFTWGLWNRVLLGAGVGAIVWGYLTLSQGSTTFAPILLVAGYCVLVPASLLLRSADNNSGE